MDRLDEITLGDIGRTLGRYRPFIAVVVSILLVAVFLPGERSGDPSNTAGQITAPGQGGDGFSGDFSSGSGPNPSAGTGGVAASGGSGGGSGGSGGGGGGQGGGDQGGGGPDLQAAAAQGRLSPTCDPNLGHVAVPSLGAPPCVEVAPNTGNDYQGVTGESIKVVYYQGEADPTTSALLTAAGAEDTDEEEQATARDWVDYYKHHYEQHGRDIELIFLKGSGPAEDDAAAIADARKVALEHKAFASLGSPNAAYTEELAAHGVMCFECQVSQPVENYQAISPHSWGVLMASTEGYIHRAEYVGKRLAGKPAQHAGDATMALQDRVFGLLYFNNDGAYESGAAFFEQHLGDEYGVDLAVRRDYEGFPETAKSQEAARPLIQAMIDNDVTSILCACDPFAPVFFTEEASRQNYFPEWIITGSALTDTTLFARLYDARQWRNAFGISFLTARMPEELSDSLRLLKWHFGQDYEPASSQYGVIRADIGLFFTGVHLAGPTLTPETFRRGMFNMPPVGTGHITQQAISYGQQVWPFDDYTAYDDITMIWWDPTATGESEVGVQGAGMYRYVDMGKRYLPGQQPNAPPKAFAPENTVTVYNEFPEGDQPPEYPHE